MPKGGGACGLIVALPIGAPDVGQGDVDAQLVTQALGEVVAPAEVITVSREERHVVPLVLPDHGGEELVLAPALVVALPVVLAHGLDLLLERLDPLPLPNQLVTKRTFPRLRK